MSKLFSPVRIGRLQIGHRVVLAPLTRMRAEEGAVPGLLMAEYYSQRSSRGGLVITEATIAIDGGNGYLGAPGLYDDSQIEGWKAIVDAAHKKGATIFVQLYHAGRQSHRDLQPGGGAPVGPSEIAHGGVAYTENGWVPNTPNRALSTEEVEDLVSGFKLATDRALAAGFDGVELHAANGYLFDQFLQDGSNKRTDRYGGSQQNRFRFLNETIEAVSSVFGYDRVAVRLAPSGSFGDMSDSNSRELFEYVVSELAKLDLAYLHLIEPRVLGNDADLSRSQEPVATRSLRKLYPGIIIVAGGFTGLSAEEIIASGDADLVAFGRYFVSNPDLPERLRNGWPLNDYDRDSFFGGTAAGYTDYTFFLQHKAS